jgi:hypothetical protein
MNAQALAEASVVTAANLHPSREITSTTLLIADRTSVPESLALQTDPYWNGWSLIRTAGSLELDRRIQTAGWHFFYLASAIKATVFGFPRQPTIRRAMKRLITAVASAEYNCVQVEDIRTGSLLGFPYVSISARPRHIQQSSVLLPRVRQRNGVTRTGSYV